MRAHRALRAPRAVLTEHRHPDEVREARPWEEPAENWAEPQSLDPTPVWKQYLLLAVLTVIFGGLFAAYCAAGAP